jgi:predicted alpha/beta hydrolase family esterase
VNLPYAAVELESDGSIHDLNQVEKARQVVATAHDVLVLVHGWNNGISSAEHLYTPLIASVEVVRGKVAAAAGRDIAAVGILWPSIKWADRDEIAGGGADVEDVDAAEEQDLIAEIRARFSKATADRMQPLVQQLNTAPSARRDYLELLREQLPDDIKDGEDAPPSSFLEGEADTVFQDAGPEGDLDGTEGGVDTAFENDDLDGTELAEGEGQGFFEDTFIRSARNLLNLTTYYTMRDRAGRVGAKGIAEVIDELHDKDRRIHLVGHSFGARAASAAANASKRPVHALVLLQGAFSHYGFAENWDKNGANGIFRDVPGRIQGPAVITHTKRDRAVGLAYAVASRLAKQVAVDIGGPDDRYGGIGRNGALMTPEALAPDALKDVGDAYTFQAGKVTNLKSDKYISNHSDVTGVQVAYALLTAVTTP